MVAVRWVGRGTAARAVSSGAPAAPRVQPDLVPQQDGVSV